MGEWVAGEQCVCVGAYVVKPDTGVSFMCVCACVDGRCVGWVNDWMDE